MKSLESKTGKIKSKNRGRPKKTKVSELTEHDQDLYQEIMEEVLKDHGIKPSVVMNKIKEKNEKGKKPDSIKKLSSATNINRTSFYKKYVKRKKKNISLIKRLWIHGLIENMCQLIYLSDGSIGRDKLYKTLYNNGFRVSSYILGSLWGNVIQVTCLCKKKVLTYQKKKSLKPFELMIMLMEISNLNILEKLFMLTLSILSFKINDGIYM